MTMKVRGIKTGQRRNVLATGVNGGGAPGRNSPGEQCGAREHRGTFTLCARLAPSTTKDHPS